LSTPTLTPTPTLTSTLHFHPIDLIDEIFSFSPPSQKPNFDNPIFETK
jgi:hypothetical protein